MRPAFRLLRAVAALGGAAFLVVPVLDASAEDQTVMVGQDNENTFSPSTVRIKPGDTVTWQYAGGTDHTVTSTTANWDKDTAVGPPAILTFSTSYLFDSPGTYRYICKTHQGAGMKGTVIVEGRVSPSPSRTTRPPSPSPTTRPPTSSPAPTGSGTPSPSAGTATPAVPSVSVPPDESESPPPLPTVAPTPGGGQSLGVGGLTAQPATGREKGLPVMLALLLIGGVGSAELRALLASTPH